MRKRWTAISLSCWEGRRTISPQRQISAMPSSTMARSTTFEPGSAAYVLYVEGGTDLDMLRALACRLKHPVADAWDERINAFYVQDNFPDSDLDSELARVEGGFGVTPQQHFFALRENGRGPRGTGDPGQRRQRAARLQRGAGFESPTGTAMKARITSSHPMS